jgi:hypothetical protein
MCRHIQQGAWRLGLEHAGIDTEDVDRPVAVFVDVG